jgi:uncharacterized protein YdeI (YjbR/CyaY-like superfamily)
MTNVDIKAFHFKNGGEWRHWLSQNHFIEKEAWLIIIKKHSSEAGISYDKALEEALCFGWIDGIMRSVDGDSFILRFSPRKARSVWSKINKEKAESLTEQGRMTEAGIAKIKEAKKNGLWEKAYSSKTKEVIPTDLEAALSANQIAWDNFYKLANTYRNMFIGWLNNARTEEIRRKRIAEIVRRAELNLKVRYGKIEN